MGYYGGLTVSGTDSFINTGIETSGIGDVNGDGIDDFGVATRVGTYAGPDQGLYIIFGDDDGGLPSNLSLDQIDGTNGVVIELAESTGSYSYGSSYGFGVDDISNLGDVNGDGIDDVGILVRQGRGYYSYSGQSAAYVLFGGTDLGASVDLGEISNPSGGTDGMVVLSDGSNRFTSIEAAHDVNGDGFNDILISQAPDGYYGGYYVASLQVASATDPAPSTGDTIGHVIFGADTSGEIELTNLDGENGFAIEGGTVDAGGYYGGGYYGGGYLENSAGQVAALGDVNGDGFADLGVRRTDVYGGSYTDPDTGEEQYGIIVSSDTFVVFGEATTATSPQVKSGPADGTSVFWDDLSGDRFYGYNNGYYFEGQSRTNFAAIGDINGDGFDDVAISSTNRVLIGERNPYAEDGDNASGVVGIIFGGPDGVNSDGTQDGLNERVSLAASDANGDLVNLPDITLVNSSEDGFGFGQTISAAGDVNGDGVADFLVGAQERNAFGGSQASDFFLVFGRDEDAGDQFPMILDLDNLDQSEADTVFYKISQNDQYSGGYNVNIEAAGDINGDGFGDLIIGQPNDDVGILTNAGRTYVIFGGEDALEAIDNADGANDNQLNIANIGVDVVSGALPIVVSVVNDGFVQTASEGSSGPTEFTYQVQRTGNLTETVSVDFAVTGNGFSPANAADFVGGIFPTGTVTFASGEAVASVVIEVNGDNAVEPNEDFAFTISDPSTDGPSDISLGVTSSFGRIFNDDFPALVSINSVVGTEDGQLVFTVTRSRDTSSEVTVDFDVAGAGFRPVSAADILDVEADGASLGGGVGQSGTLTFAIGEITKEIIVTPTDDVIIESQEMLSIILSNAQSSGEVTLGNSTGLGRINDNDFADEIFVQGGGSFNEGSTPGGFTPVTFDLVRRGDTTGVTEITYDLNPLPSQGSFFAADGQDVDSFLPNFGNTVRFEDGESLKQVTVNIIHDGIIEPRESFELRITNVETFNGVDYDILRSNATVTIRNDDGRPPIIPPGVEADVFGDPHIVTLDGLGYDFQAVGEYVLIESTMLDDPRDFQVQVRFEPLPGSDLVSVTTRMAVDVNGKTIEIDAVGDNPLLVDGVTISAEDLATGALDVDDDGRLDVFFDEELGTFTIVLNDLNEQLMVKNVDGVLNICVFLSSAEGGHANNVQGLMGNADGDISNDLMLRDSTTTFVDPTFEELYVTYANSWEVTDVERNFSDAEDAGFFPDGFPAAKISITDLPASILAAAEAAVDLAGITDPILRENAILDFALTGDDNFIEGALGLAADPTEQVVVTDAPVIPLTIGVTPAQTSVSEADGNPNTLIYTFYRIGDDSEAVSIDYAIGGDVDAADLVAGTAMTGQVVIAAGQGSVSLNVGVLNDETTELDEALVVSITGNDMGALVASSSGTTIVLTDDFAPEAQDDLFGLGADDVVTGSLLEANPTDADSDANGDTLTVIAAQASDASALTIGTAYMLASGASLTINEDGTFSFDPTGGLLASATSVYDALDAGEVASETVSYTISDGNGGTDSATATFNVLGVADAPVLAALDTFEVDENTTAVGTITASDVDSDALSFSIIGGDDAALFDIDATTGELAFLAAPDFENALDQNGDNTYEVQIQVSDGGLTDDTLALVQVQDVFEQPVLNEVVGTEGIDRLVGTDGADRIDVLGGALDIATGGAGADVFDFSSSSTNGVRERKIVTDFEVGEDLLDFGDASVTIAAGTGEQVFINLDEDGDQIILLGVSTFETDFLI
ncbi:MAG: Calx-beta domain-containing protein [Aliishimia sp.]